MIEMIFDDIPFRVDMGAVANKAGIDPEDDDLYPLLMDLAKRAQAVARPKSVIKAVTVSHEDGRVSAIGDKPFSSVILDKNLSEHDCVFAYVVTCGLELDEVDTGGDALVEYWLDAIRLQAVGAAMKHVTEYVKDHYRIKKIARLNPGSLPQWPISEQTKLFAVIGDVKAAIGVTLTDSFLMRPLKSVSGLMYETEKEYENCMLCRRFDCPGRRADFDEMMAAEYGEYVCSAKE